MQSYTMLNANPNPTKDENTSYCCWLVPVYYCYQEYIQQLLLYFSYQRAIPATTSTSDEIRPRQYICVPVAGRHARSTAPIKKGSVFTRIIYTTTILNCSTATTYYFYQSVVPQYDDEAVQIMPFQRAAIILREASINY